MQDGREDQVIELARAPGVTPHGGDFVGAAMDGNGRTWLRRTTEDATRASRGYVVGEWVPPAGGEEGAEPLPGGAALGQGNMSAAASTELTRAQQVLGPLLQERRQQ